MKYIVEAKSRGYDVVDTTAVPRADGVWCYCVDIDRALAIAKLLNDRDDRELLNRHAEELNAEGEDSATFQSVPDEHVPSESVDHNRAAYVASFEKDHGPLEPSQTAQLEAVFQDGERAQSQKAKRIKDAQHKPWEELRALGGRTNITANESVWPDEENGL